MSIDNSEVIRAATTLGVIGGGAASAHRILAALCDPALGAEQIAELVQREPGLAARVLKVANSAYYGRSREVSSVVQALLVLGLDAVRGIAAAACLDRSIVRTEPRAAIDPQALVSHSVASGFAAESLAKLRHTSIAAEAFMGALLHDFGVPVQERVDTPGVIALLEALENTPDANVSELEKSLVKIGHEQCAEIVFDAWQLPRSMVIAAKYHHDPMAAPGPARELATLVHLGVQVALEAGFIHGLEPRPLPVPREPLLKFLQIDAGSLDLIGETLAERVLLLT
jgi:HD-like signal output (HDOD) protein